MTVLLYGAMAAEARALLEHVADPVELSPIAGAPAWTGSIAGRPVLVVEGGIGLVNAAVTATAAIASRLDAPVELIVSAGTAGGISAGAAVGDVVLVDRFVLGDADARAFGYELGQVPRMPASYDGHAEAVALAVELAAETGFPTRAGSAVSTDSFIGAERSVRVLADFPGTAVVDMESASLAQVGHRHGIPVAGVRAVSDLADDATFSMQAEEAAARSAATVAALLGRLTPRS
ncbi:5'-methylthioadenosine/S-adenosylhomocysteine nucleosidase [Homoserinibacter sp. YIM 151385]|uniref:5'-methylthioadenosine/S-adenosylhomocysteine nucleosidase n=1 Tax=Homoserinibacter sp. YIM 151385 TaxID=2985506 RepID=UPI0022F0A7AF|nr:5'-methylthioadenosine/S-adenosylhomocysteine nucleosidase [Homoserinibacter sp. YIM 151385]WBU37886.1 5'-methylthioadenosine/S-adenosylhomocysteine nucleosidase [Homoserinibacter sp. YIM 151385]